MDRLSEIRARCEAFEDSSDSYKGVRPQYILPVLADDGYSRNWAEIAAHSHEDTPYLLARLEKAEAKIKSIHESLNFADKSRSKCANYVELAVSNGLALGRIAVAIQHDYDAEPPKGE